MTRKYLEFEYGKGFVCGEEIVAVATAWQMSERKFNISYTIMDDGKA